MEEFTKGAKRRSEIVLHAKKIFGTRGYSETSIHDIAVACEITQSAVLYHFKNKLTLFKAVVSAIITENAQIISAMIDLNDSAYEKLLKHFEGHWVWAVKNKHNAKIMTSIYHLATFEEEFRTMYSEILKVAREKILSHLLAGQRERLFFLKSDPEIISQLLHDQLLGCLLNTVTSKPTDNSHAMAKKKWVLMLSSLTGFQQKA